jgi:predicted GH43/DUF377 family glycosyl hydrolase
MKITAHKFSGNPILTPVTTAGSFERACVYNPAAVIKDDKVHLIYRAEEEYYTYYISRLGLAVSDDGFNFTRYEKNPVVEEEEGNPHEKHGCEDPRLIRLDNDNFFLTYVAFAGDYIKLSGAFSKDLKTFEKIGELIHGEKSGAIVQDYKFENKYVMYYGDLDIKIAFSEDLRTWHVDEEPVLRRRHGHFDSFLIEGGPPPIVTDEGILVIYNSAKEGPRYKGDKIWQYYAPGFALFDKDDPAKLLYRSNHPLIEPTEYFEKYGKVNYVIFASGLVNFRGKWLLYYGGADKSIGVAELEF